MSDKSLGRISVLGFSLIVILFGGALETAFSHTSVRETTQNVNGDQRLSLKIPQGEALVVEEEKEEPSSRGEEKPLPEMPKSKVKPERKEMPPKKFVPSEKIPADQAVDFPADI